MAKPGRATQAKRSRELAKQDKRRDKEERRAQKKDEKGNEINSPAYLAGHADEDPDLAGIVRGPHNTPIWD